MCTVHGSGRKERQRWSSRSFEKQKSGNIHPPKNKEGEEKQERKIGFKIRVSAARKVYVEDTRKSDTLLQFWWMYGNIRTRGHSSGRGRGRGDNLQISPTGVFLVDAKPELTVQFSHKEEFLPGEISPSPPGRPQENGGKHVKRWDEKGFFEGVIFGILAHCTQWCGFAHFRYRSFALEEKNFPQKVLLFV